MGVCGVHELMCIKVFKRRAGLGYTLTYYYYNVMKNSYTTTNLKNKAVFNLK